MNIFFPHHLAMYLVFIDWDRFYQGEGRKLYAALYAVVKLPLTSLIRYAGNLEQSSRNRKQNLDVKFR